MPLNAKQQEAVSHLSGPLLVLAGPGTGKTQLLSAKVAYILEHTDANPENILCITFTDSGAKNMRERLSSMIGQAANQVNIYTYHRFGTNILERYQNYAEKLDRKIDSPIDNVTQYKIIHDIQANLPIDDILKDANSNDLSETIQNAKSARLSSEQLRQIAERNLEDSQKISDLASTHLANLAPRSKFDVALADVYEPLLEDLAAYTNKKPITGEIEPIANLLVRELSEVIAAEQPQDKPSVRPLSRWKDAHFERTETDYRLKDYIANKKLLSLANVMQQYDERLRYEGWFDFADMIEEAIKALKTDTGFKLDLSEKFQYILLDEFQDTNPSQFELIKLITDYERPMIMAVGDDDQAIFEFQGANASNLIDFQQHYHADFITLTDNYRSTSEILAFSHRVAEQVNDSFAKHHQITKVLRSMLDQLNSKTLVKASTSKIARHEFTHAEQEYYWVANEIKRLINSGENPSDIAIIAPKHKYVAPLLPYLKAQDINIAYEKKSNLIEDEQIHELLTLAEYIFDLSENKTPAHSILEILSYPFWQVAPLDALRITTQDRHKSGLDCLAEAKDEHLQQIAATLAELVTLSFDTPLELWLDYLLGKLELPGSHYRIPFLTFYAAHHDEVAQIELYENLAALRDTIVSHIKVSSPRLRDLITMLQDYEAANADIVKTVSYRDHEQAVQVMSAHKSKGLEFKYVFLIALDDWAWGKSKGNNNMFVLPANLSQIRHTGATDDERLRLFFVAITRAKDTLVMTNSIYDFSGKEVGRLSYLAEQRDEKAEQQLSPYLPDQAQQIQTHYDDFNAAATLEIKSVAWSSAYQVLQPDLEILLKRNLENYRLSATDLTSFIDIIYAGPESIYRRRAMLVSDEPLTPQIAYGNLMHGVFEQITNQGITDDAAIEACRLKALDQPLTPHEITELQQKTEHSLKIALSEFAPILRHPHAKAEINLSPEHLVFENTPITGKIDHINIDPEHKTIEIYDFKTGNYHAQNWQSHFTLYKYALQLEFYKLLLNLSPTYRNYQVTAGHILFVTPDNEGKVYDKIYDYTPASAERLQKLVVNIYKLITSLQLVKDPAINLTADATRTLKNIKEFVDLILDYQF